MKKGGQLWMEINNPTLSSVNRHQKNLSNCPKLLDHHSASVLRTAVLPAMPEIPAVVVLFALPLSLPTPAPTPLTPNLPTCWPTSALTPAALPLKLALFWRSLMLNAPLVVKVFLLLSTALWVLAITAPFKSVLLLTVT